MANVSLENLNEYKKFPIKITPHKKKYINKITSLEELNIYKKFPIKITLYKKFRLNSIDTDIRLF